MEGPGMSLFQGAASIHINNSAQDRLEEQEELEDEKRRNEELQNKLATAFDDLQYDDEVSSVNSSGNHTLDTPQTNGVRGGHPPTYLESLNHLKENQHSTESPKYCETPKNHMHHMGTQNDVIKHSYSPYGAGDGHNHYFSPEDRGHVNGITDVRHELMNHEKLKTLYEIRIKESQEYATQIKNMEQEIESLRGRLSAALQDKNSAEFSLQKSHDLLAASKHKSIEQEQKLTSLSEKLMRSDEEKEQLKIELQATSVKLQEEQQRAFTMQVTHTHNTDALFRDQQDRHREEVDRLHNDLMKARSRLEKKDNEIKVLEKRYNDCVREKNEILVERDATNNKLSSEQEAAQRLRGERGAAREQLKVLGSKLESTAHELVMCRKKLEASQAECEGWRSALNQILLEYLPGNTCTIGDSPSPAKLEKLRGIFSRYKLQLQNLPTLQEELAKRDKRLEHHRKQESELRAKLEESKGIELQLNSRLAVLQNKLDLLESGEGHLLDTYKQQNEQLRKDLEDVRTALKNEELKFAELEMEYEKLKTEKGSRASLVQEANADLLRELQRYGDRLKEARAENGELKTLYLQVCSARDSVNREYRDYQTKTQREKEIFKTQEKDLIEKIEREKQQVERLNAELVSTKEDLDRANKRISELQKEFTDKQKEFTDKLNKFLEDEKIAMRKEMSACIQCENQLKHIRNLEEQISKYSVKLAAQESNETLIKELKAKAEFFQQYIVERYKRQSQQCSVATNTDGDDERQHERQHECDRQDDERDNRHDHRDELEAKTALMMKEKAIRDQLSEKFTLEIKTIEMNCARRLKEMETEQLTAVTKLKNLLERKAKEVETLKEFILTERTKITQILESKENEISVLIKEHNELQAECQKAKDDCAEWKHKAEKYKERLSHLGSLEDVLKREKEDWKEKTSSSAKECQMLKTKVVELHSTISHLEQQYMKLQKDHQTVQEKYKNAKRTVITYKDYMSKKDTHIHNEMNRIQEEYRKIFVKLQNQINYHVSRRVHEETRALPPGQRAHDTDYTEKLNELTQDFARLAQTNINNDFDNK